MIRALLIAHNVAVRAFAVAALGALSSCATPSGSAGPAPIEYRGDDDGLGDRRLSARATRPAPVALRPDAPQASQASGPRRVARDGEIVVAAGATLYQIAEQHRVSLRGLIDANELEAPFALNAGQVLKLPPPNTYVVQRGDTLYAIARRHRVQPRSLALLNDMGAPYAITPGDEIMLPGSARDWQAYASARPTPAAPAAASTAPARDGVTIVRSPPSASRPRPATTAVTGPAPSFDWPVRGDVIDSFGPKAAGRRNDGINIAAPEGSPVNAVADGLVVYAGDELAGYGNLVLIKHPDGWVSAYAHNRALLVTPDQVITKGQAIAEIGSTGSVETPQLHFELRRAGRPVDPATALPRLAG